MPSIRRFLFETGGTLNTRSLRAAVWTVGGRGLSQGLRLASSLVLTRLLAPEAFGLMAMAQVVLMLVGLLAETGVRPAMIQNPRGAEPAFLITAWTIGVARSAVLLLVYTLVASPMAAFYGQPELTGLVIVIGLGAFVQGFESPGVILLLRELDARRQTLLDLARQFAGFIVTIGFALIWRNVWALAVGIVVGNSLGVVTSYVLRPYRPALHWNRGAAAQLFSYGKFIFLNTLITFAVMNGDRLLLGKLLSMQDLGYFALALNLALPLPLLLIQLQSQVLFPAISTCPGDVEFARRSFERVVRLLGLTVFPVMAIVAVFGDSIVKLLYDSRYAPAGMVLSWMGVRFLFFTVHVMQGGVFLALGKPRYETFSFAAGLACLLVLLPVATERWGLAGAAIATCCTGLAVTLAGGCLMIRATQMAAAVLIRAWSLAFLTLASVWLIRQAVMRLWPFGHADVIAMVCAIVVLIAWGVLRRDQLVDVLLGGRQAHQPVVPAVASAAPRAV